MRSLIVVIVLVAGCKKPAPTKSQLDLAKLEVTQLAVEAYPLWARDHADKPCPDSLDVLKEFTNRADLNDPWNHPLRMLCGPDAPAGAHGFGAYSLGPDGTDGTADDIKSWADAKN